MILPLRLSAVAAVLALLALPIGGAAPPQRAAGTGEPVRIRSELFGVPASVQVAENAPAEAEAAARDAFDRMVEAEEQVLAAEESLGTASGDERAIELPEAVLGLLERALSFCRWSNGAFGPLGGSGAAADCNRLAVDREAGTARLAAGSRLELAGFARGFAVDRGIERLRERGVESALIRVGHVRRGIGGGPAVGGDPEKRAGPGWPVLLPVFEGYRQPLEEVTLRDRSLAVEWRAEWPPEEPRFVDRRTGEPPAAVWATVAVTELAVDAQAVAVAAMVLGGREGRFRLAGLRPPPSVLWLLGSGQARPLLMHLNWSALHDPADRSLPGTAPSSPSRDPS